MSAPASRKTLVAGGSGPFAGFERLRTEGKTGHKTGNSRRQRGKI
jgi:hypothetical protein